MFISSVIKGLEDERAAAARAIRTCGAEPVMFETFGGRDESANAAYLAEVASSDVYVGILGANYGATLPSGRSATHEEYLEAEKRGLHVSIWVDSAADREALQSEWLTTIRSMHTTGSFNSPPDLEANLRRRIEEMAAQDLAPWIKLGPVIFRARRIDESSGSAHVLAQIRDDDVIEALRELGGGLRTLGSGGYLLTVGGRTRAVIVRGVTTVTSAGTTKTVEIDLDVRGLPNTTLAPTYTTGGKTYSPMDLCELAIRRLLGQADEDIEATAMMTNIGMPLTSLLGLRLPPGSMSAVAGLLLTEAVVAHGFAGRITRFRMGPESSGKRLIDVTWEEVKRYSNVEPERRRLETQIAWRA